MIINPEYKEMYEQLHGEGKFAGGSVVKHSDAIVNLILDCDAVTILYCGS